MSKTRLCAPLEVIVASADPVPTTVSPVPFGAMLIFTLESLLPVAEIVGALPLAAFAIVNSLVAEPVAVNLNNSVEEIPVSTKFGFVA